MNFDRWDELGRPRDLAQIFESVEFAAWKSFRESEDHVHCLGPFTLAPAAFWPGCLTSIKFKKVDEFNYEENVDGTDHDKYSWMSRVLGLRFPRDGRLRQGRLDDAHARRGRRRQGRRSAPCIPSPPTTATWR